MTDTINCLLAFLLNLRMDRRRAPTLAHVLRITKSMWGDHVRRSSMMTPRIRVLVTRVNTWSLSITGTDRCRGSLKMTMATILAELTDNPRSARSRASTESTLLTAPTASFGDLLLAYSVMSSANIGSLQERASAVSGSFRTYILKNTGPGMVPWGTPVGTGTRGDVPMWVTTRCCRPRRYDWNQARAMPELPTAAIAMRSCWCCTVSNAFFRSTQTTAVCRPASRASSQSFVTFVRSCAVDRCFRKPNWSSWNGQRSWVNNGVWWWGPLRSADQRSRLHSLHENLQRFRSQKNTFKPSR